MSSGLRLSIGANLVLAGLVAYLLWRGPPPPLPSAAPATRPAPALQRTANSATERPSLRPGSAATTFTPTAVARLEQMGMSRELLINVLLENLNRRSAKRVMELQKKYAPKPVPDRELRDCLRESDAEQIRELKVAFGEDGYRAWDKEQTLHTLNRARAPGDELPMTAEEADQAYRLQKEFDEKNQELQMAMQDGVADKVDASTLQAQAQQALDRELEKLLGKTRFDELRGNTDPTTEVYRTFGDLNPTPEQANAVVNAEAEYRAREAALARRLNDTPGDAANLTTELKAMSDAQDETLRQIFGAEAYDKIKRQSDPTYKALQQYGEAWELNPREIQSVYAALQPFQDQANRTRIAAQMSEAAGQPVNWRQINAVIDQAQQQTEASLQNLIGAERLHRLKQNGLLSLH